MNDEQIAYMTKWAAQQGGHLEIKGEVGFFRPCVGVVKGTGYLDFFWTEWDDDEETRKAIYQNENIQAFRRAAPEDAYHKHPCMAVLVHDDDYEKALVQLYDWIKWCDENGWGAVETDRKTLNKPGTAGAEMELFLHGRRNNELRPV